MDKFIARAVTKDPLIKNKSDQTVARFGHLNEIVRDLSKYKSYVAIISQSETDAPTAIVLQNDFDTELVFNYQSVGKYFITSEKPIFNQNKTLLFTSGGPGNNLITSAEFSNENTLGFGSINLTQDEPAPSNGFSGTSLEIRVYNT